MIPVMNDKSAGFEALLEVGLAGDGAAVVCGAAEWSRIRLGEEVAKVAGTLAAFGCGAGDIVAVEMKRAPAMIAALLGVWRAGAAYLTLDPGYPEERLSFMREDSGARFAVIASPPPCTAGTHGGPTLSQSVASSTTRSMPTS